MKPNLILIDKKLGKENDQKVVDLIRELYPYLNLDAIAKLSGISKTKVKEIAKANGLTKNDPAWFQNTPIVIWLPRELADKVDVDELKFVKGDKNDK